MRCVSYKRISTENQELENQTDSIDKQIELFGWNKVGEYQEVISGMKSRDTRPQLRQLLADARKHKFDRVIVFELSRLGRSVVDVINTIHELEECGVHLFVISNALDTSTSQGKLFSYFVNIFNSMEREMMLNRQSESIKRLREKGAKWGNGNLITQDKRDRIVLLRSQGLSYRGIVKEVEVSLGSVQHVLKTHQEVDTSVQ